MTDSIQRVRESYDAFPYHSFAYAHSAPENMAAVAHLFGIETPDVRTARVLELGCASGGNLIPFAVRNPKASAVGIDLSDVQVEEGQRRIAALGLPNIELRALDLRSITKTFGEFDYIICHGLYSWVPDEVRHAILRICRENLSAKGVAYVSYKTYPGWKAHEIVRDAMMLRAGGEGDIRQRLALGRGVIGFLRTHARGGSVLAKAIEQDHETIGRADANYIAHDFLAEFSKPCYFLDFARDADAHDLTYLAEADPKSMFAANYGDAIAGPLVDECRGNQILLEQYLDFVGDRSFRSSLIVHAGRGGDIRYGLEPARLRQLHVAAQLVCVDGDVRLDASPQRFSTFTGSAVVLTDIVTKAAALALAHASPFTMTFDQMRDAVRERIDCASTPEDALDDVLSAFIEMLVIRGMSGYRLTPVARSTAKPSVCEAARRYPAHLSDGQAPHTFNAWHEPVVLDAAGQLLLPFIDGKRTRQELLVMLEQGLKRGLSLGAESPAAALDRVLRQLCV